MSTLAYLAPELPALSATFVYEELLGLERRGLHIVPVTIRAPASPARGQEALAGRTRVLYDGSPLALAWQGLLAMPRFGAGAARALGMVLGDMLRVRPWRAIAWKLAYQCLMGARLAALLRRERCSHLHVHFAHTPAQIAMYASAFAGVPFTVMAHANDIFERGLLLPEKARRALRLLTISRFNREHLRSLGVDDARIAVVRCGLSIPVREDSPDFSPKARYRIGTLCRLVEKKGVDDLLRAVALLQDRPEVELQIAGDGPLRPALEALARELGIVERVRFLGPVAHDAVTGWLSSLDLFVVACKADANGDMDGIPVALMEAMSQRVPVLSTRLSGIPELVIHEQTGLLSVPADPASLAAEMPRLLGDVALCRRLTEAAVQHVRAEFGLEANLDRLIACMARPPSEAHSQVAPSIDRQ
ncbi:phosphatidyl-myo-inositol dimannoside synthase [Planctomycetaceae bacterium]|nr:phosphatidyl-myo-inositol dimannoside synthase [Planctomycetaceae bacterium]